MAMNRDDRKLPSWPSKWLALAAAAVALMLSACVSPQRIPAEKASQFKRIGVLSLVADRFSRQYVAVTVFGNQREQQPILEWAVDEAYETQIAAAASKVFDASSVSARDWSSRFEEVHKLNGPWDAPVFWGPNWTVIEPVVHQYCVDNGTDALIIAARKKSDDFIGQTNQTLDGAGIYARKKLSMLHVLAEVAMFDCSTGKVIASRLLASADSPSVYKMHSSMPVEPIDRLVSNASMQTWSDEQRANVRSRLIHLPKDSWEMTLKQMRSH